MFYDIEVETPKKYCKLKKMFFDSKLTFEKFCLAYDPATRGQKIFLTFIKNKYDKKRKKYIRLRLCIKPYGLYEDFQEEELIRICRTFGEEKELIGW